ncbi:variant surface glycoprotein [Trypanosoma equiperdum]|uniref:Variant surface glycoprotein n=1 Tax=Trypanosoma equiperdum TaxID=5694 RepID=A0A1G4I2S9_TRYEQ|nr:variant surface glycoprotein [Trypanosoma equiperdum]
MQKAAILAVAFFLAADTLSRHAAAVTAGENVVFGALLCPSLRLGDAPVTFRPALADAPKPPLELYKLNMSLADPAWRKLFTPEGEGAAKKPKAKPSENFPVEWTDKWQVWADAEKALQENGAEKNLMDRLGLQHVAESTKGQIRAAVAAYTETAFEIYSNFEKVNKQTPDDDTKIKGELLTALYGGSAGYDSSGENGKLYTGTKGGYAAVCGEGSTNDAMVTLAATYACVCGVASTKNSVHPCHPDTTTQPQWEAGGIITTANWKNVRIACPVIKNQPVTAERLAAALESGKAAITVQGTDAYIGPYNSPNGCDGDTGASCVKIATASTDHKLTDSKVQWIGKLSVVAMQLRSCSEYNQKATVTAEKLTKLTALAEAHAKLSKLIPSIPTTTSATSGDKNSEAKKAQTNCEAIQTAAECKTKTECKWEGPYDKDGKHCKLNTTAVEQATQAGTGGENQTTSECIDKPQKG